MKLKKWMHYVLVGASILSLSACSTFQKKPPQDQSAVNAANNAYQMQNDEAQTSGAGDETQFGEQGTRDQLLSKTVYYFDFDSNAVHEDDKPAILANAEYLSAHPNAKVLLEGHTDPRGSREYNIGLGERRAKAVAAVLTAKGVNPAQIRIVSYGAEKLAVSGHSASDYQQDRRVVLVYLQR